MENNIRKKLDNLRSAIKTGGDPERAVNEKRYLKSPFRFFGTSLPFTDKTARAFRKENPDLDRKSVVWLSESLWASQYHDEKRLALRIFQCYPEYLDLSLMPMFEAMLMDSPTWDLVDDISIHLVGAVLEKDGKARGHLERWSGSENFWMRRASLISQILLLRRGSGDKALFFRCAEKMTGDKEFFIRKAIGWGIREMSKADPSGAFDFLMKIRVRASGLTLREGAKRLPEDMRKTILQK
jgi:3-methyladenine DNA glycosylase AlkD